MVHGSSNPLVKAFSSLPWYYLVSHCGHIALSNTHLVRALAAHSWPGVEGVLGGIRPGAQRTGAVRLAHRVTAAWEEIFLNYYTSNIICRRACNIRRTYESHNLPVVEVHAAKHVPRLQVHTK